MTAIIVDLQGARPMGEVGQLAALAEGGAVFWLDVSGGETEAQALPLGKLGFEATDVAWAMRFGQGGRMNVARGRLRVATWLAAPSGRLVEIHILCRRHCVLTVWSGDPSLIDEIRQQFAERACGVDGSPFYAGAILLHLLLGTLDQAIGALDRMLDDLRLRLGRPAGATEIGRLALGLQKLQSVVAGFNRYSSAVRSALVGVEAVDGMDARAVEELDDYADQVEDIEEQLFVRRQWITDMMQDHANAIAQRQGEQINRLTLVSLIFLPMTAITGFFGMNFDWLIRQLASREAFIALGVLFPVLCVALTVAWLLRRGLIHLTPRLVASPPTEAFDERDALLGEFGLPDRLGEAPGH